MKTHKFQIHRRAQRATPVTSKLLSKQTSTYTEAKIQQEEDVERHVDLQREVFVEVMTGLDRTIKEKNKLCLFPLALIVR